MNQKGESVTPNYQFDSELKEQALVKRIVRLGMTVFDVGANVGKYTKFLSLLVGESGRVFAFEPTPTSWQRIARFISECCLTNVTLINKAVCERSGKVLLNQFPEEYSSWNSLGCPKMKDPKNPSRLVPIVSSVEVEAVTLDAFCREQNVHRVDYLKLDVEGAEIQALEGACELLEKKAIRYLQFEVSQKMLEGLQTKARLVFDRLSEHGYECHRITADGTIGEKVQDSSEFYENYIAVADPLDVFVSQSPPKLDYSLIKARVEAVPGLLCPGQEEFLFNKVRSLSDDAVIVEIGSFKGRSTVTMGHACAGTRRRIYCIDTWDIEDWQGTEQFPAQGTFAIWQEHVRKNDLGSRVKPLQGRSHEVLSRWAELSEGRTIDFVFIDGSHTYEDVLRDFELALPLVKPGGWIAFHDVVHTWPGPERVWHGVAKSHLVNHEYCSTIACGQKPVRRTQKPSFQEPPSLLGNGSNSSENKLRLPESFTGLQDASEEHQPDVKTFGSRQVFSPRISFVVIVLNGMPFIEFGLRAIYQFAHEILVIEGAVEKCLFAANPDGSSKDGTVECINNFPDPAKKIRMIQGRWPEKCEMQNEALQHVTGDYVWLMDSDEIYRGEDLEKVRNMIVKDPSITQINLIPDNFWKGFDYIFVSPEFFKPAHHYRRIFKFVSGARFTSHRPPTLLLPGSDRTADQQNCVSGDATRSMGIVPFHYSYVFKSQVRQKIELYNRYGWGKRWDIDMNEWFHEGFLKWTPENRVEIEKKYPPWTGDKNSHTEAFTGEHPEVMGQFIVEWRNKKRLELNQHADRESSEPDLLEQIGNITFQRKVLQAWQNIELDTPLLKRRTVIAENMAKGVPFWNVHVALAFIATRLQPKSYLEIGVRTGGSLVQVLHSASVREVVAIDLWAGSYANLPNTKKFTQEQIERFQKLTQTSCSVRLVRGNSHTELKKLIREGFKFDLINVDGDHSEAGAWEDLEDAIQLLSDRGAILFDDIIHPGHPYLLPLIKKYAHVHPDLRILLNTTQDNGCAILLKNFELKDLQSVERSQPRRKGVRIAGEVAANTTGDLTQIDSESAFATAIRKVFLEARPLRIIETGTYHGTGTTKIISSTLRELNLENAIFHSIEVNPRHLDVAKQNLTQTGLSGYVQLKRGLSVPRRLLPSLQEVEEKTVRNIEFDDIYVDHKEHERALLYCRETDFSAAQDDCLGECLREFHCRPDFVLLDSAGHLGNIEFNYAIGQLKGPCFIALDDIYHVKHRKSFEQIKHDPRFEIVVASEEKFGFCIAKFTPQGAIRQEVKSLVFLRTDSIGDNALAASMLAPLQDHFRDASFTVICQDHVAELYEACPFVHQIVSFNRNKALKDESYRTALANQLQKLEADVCLNSVYSREPLTDFLATAVQVRERIAFEGGLENISKDCRERHNCAYTRLIPNGSDWMPELERHRDFLKGLGINDANLQPSIWLNVEDEAYAEEFLQRNALDSSKTIVLFAGAQSEVRVYPNYGQALSDVCRERGFAVVALGTKKEEQINQRALDATGVRTFNLSGATTLRQSAALLKRCRLAVGAETGLAHIACAVGTPNVVLLGGGHFGRFMPYSPLTSAVALPLECFGCNWRCRYQRPHCVEDVVPAVLSEAVRQTLAKPSAKPRVFVQNSSHPLTAGVGPRWKWLDENLNASVVEIIRVGPGASPNVLETSSPVVSSTEMVIAQALEAANSFVMKGDLRSARTQLECALESNPTSFELIAALGHIQFQLGNFESAQRSFARAAQLEPDDPTAFVQLAVANLKLDRVEEFETALGRALELNPSHRDALKLLADLHLKEGSFYLAAQSYGKLIHQTPDDIEILLPLGICFFKTGELETAKTVFERILQIQPDHALAKENLEVVKNKIPAPQETSDGPWPESGQDLVPDRGQQSSVKLEPDSGARRLALPGYSQPPAGLVEKWIAVQPAQSSGPIASTYQALKDYSVRDFGVGLPAVEAILAHIAKRKFQTVPQVKPDFWRRTVVLTVSCDLSSAEKKQTFAELAVRSLDDISPDLARTEPGRVPDIERYAQLVRDGVDLGPALYISGRALNQSMAAPKAEAKGIYMIDGARRITASALAQQRSINVLLILVEDEYAELLSDSEKRTLQSQLGALTWFNNYQAIPLVGLKGQRTLSRFDLIDMALLRDQTVMDFGCNIGQACLQAVQAGAKLVIGVEGMTDTFHLAEDIRKLCGFTNVQYLNVDFNRADFESVIEEVHPGTVDYSFFFSVYRTKELKQRDRLFQYIIDKTQKGIFFEGHAHSVIDTMDYYSWLFDCFGLKHQFLGYSEGKLRPLFYLPLNKDAQHPIVKLGRSQHEKAHNSGLVQEGQCLLTSAATAEARTARRLVSASSPSEQLQGTKEQSAQARKVEPKGYLVSAIVSVYQCERFIEGKLRDLLHQSLGGRLEIILIDSNSPENEWRIIQEFAARHSNIKYIRTEKRESLYEAWNRGVRVASGKYITNSNTDDRLHPDALSVMACELDRHPEICLVYGDFFITSFENMTVLDHVRCGYSLKPEYAPDIMLSGCHIGPQPMWRKSVHEEIGYFDEQFVVAGDYEFWCRMASGHAMKHIPEFLGLYFHNPNGIANRNKETEALETTLVQKLYADKLPSPCQGLPTGYYFSAPVERHRYVNVCMVTYNRLEYTRRAIQGLLRYTRYPHVITVVDNGSEDGTRKYLLELKTKGIIKNLILLDENVGVAKASNLAWHQEPSAEFYIKFDNDIVIQKPDWLEKMVQVVEAAQQIGVLGYNFEPISYPLTEVNGVSLRIKTQGNIGGACIMIPRRTQRRLGFWCEDYGLYSEEDNDYGVRVALAGLLNVYMADENIGVHLPSGRAAAIDSTSLVADDPCEIAEQPEYRRWKDTQRRQTVCGDKFRGNIAAYFSRTRSLYVDSEFVESYASSKANRDSNGLSTERGAEPVPMTLSEINRLVMQADADYRNGNFDAARRALVEAERLAPNDPRVVSALGATLFALGNFSSSQQQFLRASQLQPNEPSSFVQLALACLKLDQIEEFEKALGRALQIDPLHREALKLLADLNFQTERFKDAAETYVKILRRQEDDLEALLALGVCFVKLNDLETAQTVFERVLERYPDNALARENLDWLRQKMGARKPTASGESPAQETPSKSLTENSGLGSTGYQPAPSGNLPDGTGATSMNNPGAGLAATPTPIPVGKLPTGAGQLPAPPIFQTGSKARAASLSQLVEEANFFSDVGNHEAALESLQQAAELAPDDWQILSELGSLQFTQGNFEAARDQFRRVIELCPRDPDAYTRLAMTCLKLNRIEELESALGIALEIDPDHREALRFLAKTNLENNRVRDAGRAYARLLEKKPDDIDSLLSLGLCFYRGGELDTARLVYKRVLEFEPENPTARENLSQLDRLEKRIDPIRTGTLSAPAAQPGGPPEINRWLAKADAAFGSQNLAGARDALRAALELAPNSPDILSALGSLCFQLGEMAEARTLLRRLVQVSAPDAGKWVQLALAHYQLGEIEEFESALGRALELEPNHLEALRLLAHLNFNHGSIADAAQTYGKVLKQTPDDLEVILALGVCFFKTRDYESAKMMFERVLELDPKNSLATDNLRVVEAKLTGAAQTSQTIGLSQTASETVEALLIEAEAGVKQGNLAAACVALERALRLAPELPGVQAAYGSLLFQVGDLERSRAALARAAELSPESADYQTRLALVLVKLDRIDEFEVAMRRALELDPNYRPALKLQADLNFQQGHLKEAAQLYNRVLRQTPDDVEIMLPLGVCFYKSSELEGAATVFERVLDLQPGNELAKNNLAMIRRKVAGTEQSQAAFPLTPTLSPKEGESSYPAQEKSLDSGRILSPENALPILEGGGRGEGKGDVELNRPRSSASVESVSVSIIIPVFNQLHFTRRCLAAIKQHTEEKLTYEIIVVDNGSFDGTTDFLRQEQAAKRLKAVMNHENKGFACACNVGARAAFGEYLMFLNNDTEVQAGWLESLIAILNSDPRVGAVGSKLLFPDMSIQHAGVAVFDDQVLPDPLVARHVYYKQRSDLPEANQPRVYQALTAACLLVRKAAFQKVGGFDEGYWNGYEDVDLCFKLQESGALLVYEPSSVVIHHESKSGSERFRCVSRNVERLHSKWLGKITPDLTIRPDASVSRPAIGKIGPYSRSLALHPKQQVCASIVTLTLNQLDHTKKCLDSIQAYTPEMHELIIVDNGSTDGTVEFLKELQSTHDNVKVIFNSKNRGFSAGNNQGLAFADGEFALLLNNDTVVTPGWLRRLLSVFERYPEVGIVGPVSNYVSGPQQVPQVGYQTLDGLPEFARAWAADHDRQILEINRVVGFCLMARRAVLQRIGGLDEQFGSGNFEDDDFCLRARLAGFRAVVAKDVFIHHTGSVTFRGAKIDYSQSLRRNWELFRTKWNLGPESTMDRGYRAPVVPFDPSKHRVPLPSREESARLGQDAGGDTVALPAHTENVPFEVPAVARLGSLQNVHDSLAKKEYLKAWDAALDAIRLRPFHPDAYLQMADIALAAGDERQALRCAERLVQMTPNWEMARKVYASLNTRKKPRRSKIKWTPLPAQTGKPRLSVCLIVKNEEEFLGRCLDSVKPIASQIVVVDTGSTDQTVAIAKAHGAEVHFFAWNDNFSDARNAAHERARGDWVLVLDADEELPVESHEKLAQDMAAANVLGYRIPICNLQEASDAVTYVPRLFRNAPALFFVSRVHEQIYASVLARKADWGMEAKMGTATIVHHGYDPGLVLRRQKIKRNLRLLERAIEELPNEAALIMNYGLDLVNDGRLEEGLEKYRQAFRIMEPHPATAILPEVRERLLTLFGVHLVKANRFEEVVEVLTSRLARDSGPTASICFLVALALMRLNRGAEAIPHLRDCLNRRHIPAMTPPCREILKGGPHHLLAECLAKTGQSTEAEEQYKRALEQEPEAPGIIHDYAFFLHQQNRSVEALQTVHGAVHKGINDERLWHLGGFIVNSQAEFLDFGLEWTAEALQFFPDHPGIRGFRGETLLKAGRIEEALPFFRQADGPGQPSARAAIILCELVLDRHPTGVTPDEEGKTSGEFIGWYRRLLATNAKSAVLAVNSRIEVLRRILPTAARLIEKAVNEAESSERG